MRTRIACALVVVAACGDGASPVEPDAAPDGSTTPDAPPASARRYLISRGLAGAETLYSVDGDRVDVISDGAGSSWCGGKIFCNLPPNGSIGRFAFARYVDATHAFYLELDPIDWSNLRAVSVDLATTDRTDLAAAVPWPATTPDWPINYVVASAAAAGTIWVSVPINGGMGLYRTDGTSALVEVATTRTPNGMTYMESSIDASASGAVWNVRWRRGVVDPDPYDYITVVVAADGAVQFRVPDDITGAVDGADRSFLVDGVATIHWERGDGTYALELYDLATGARRSLDIASAYVALTGPGGDGVVLVGVAGSDTTHVISTATGAALDQIEGQSWGVHDQRVFYRGASPYDLRERDWAAHTERVIAPDTSISFNAMGGVVAPGGDVVAVADGIPFLDLNDNVGITLVDRATLATTVVEPTASSEVFTREMTFISDGSWLLYLNPVGDTLQLAGFERATGEHVQLTTGTEHVRQIVVP